MPPFPINIPSSTVRLGSADPDVLKPELYSVYGNQGRGGAGPRPLQPTEGMLKFGAEQQKQQELQTMASQYLGDPNNPDYNGLINAWGQRDPEGALRMREQYEKSLKAHAETTVAESQATAAKLDDASLFVKAAIANPSVYPSVRASAVSKYGDYAEKFLPPVDDPNLEQHLGGVLQVMNQHADFLKNRAEAAQTYADGKKTDGMLMNLAIADTPEKWALASKEAQAANLGDLPTQAQDAAGAQAMLAKRQALAPEKPGTEKGGQAKEGIYQGKRTFGVFDPNTNTFMVDGKQVSASEFRPIAPQSAGGGGLGPAAVATQAPERVKYWADQIQKDPSFATSPLISGKENSALRTAVANELVTRGQSLDKMTAQTRQMGETAKAILPHISTIEQEAQQLNAKGLMGPVGSRWREFVSGTLKANAIATNPADAQLIGKFQADLGLLRSAVARAHGGARGGGSPTMIEHMKTIIQGGGDFPTFQGSLGAVKEWMQTYADDAKQDTGGAKEGDVKPIPGYAGTEQTFKNGKWIRTK